MILAGDIGGTKTVLALVDPGAGVTQPAYEQRFPSKENDSLDAIVFEFLDPRFQSSTARRRVGCARSERYT
jgi:glucokinase